MPGRALQRLKRYSLAGDTNASAVSHAQRQIARAATLKRFQLSHKELSELDTDDVVMGKLQDGTYCCGSSSTAARVGAQLLRKLFQWFPDASIEKNYRYFSFTTGHVQLSNLMLIGAAFYTLVLVADAAFSGGARPPNGPNIAIRLSIGSMGVAMGLCLRHLQLTPRTTTAVLLLILIMGGLLPNYLTVGSARESVSDETFEQVCAITEGGTIARRPHRYSSGGAGR
jgi:hypothetical protein